MPYTSCLYLCFAHVSRALGAIITRQRITKTDDCHLSTATSRDDGGFPRIDASFAPHAHSLLPLSRTQRSISSSSLSRLFIYLQRLFLGFFLWFVFLLATSFFSIRGIKDIEVLEKKEKKKEKMKQKAKTFNQKEMRFLRAKQQKRKLNETKNKSNNQRN